MKKFVFALVVAVVLAAVSAGAESIVQILDGTNAPYTCYVSITDTETGQVTYQWMSPCPEGS